MITNYENKGTPTATRYTEKLCICTVVTGRIRWCDPVPAKWTKDEVADDMCRTWGDGVLCRDRDKEGWTYTTDDPNATERRQHATE